MRQHHVLFHRYVGVFQSNVHILVEENLNHVYHLMVHNDVFV
jgi:hypothetical protein